MKRDRCPARRVRVKTYDVTSEVISSIRAGPRARAARPHHAKNCITKAPCARDRGAGHNLTMSAASTPPVARTDSAEREFKRLDTNQSGTLSRSEVYAGLREKGLPASKEQIDAWFAKVDGDGDGEITLDEYRNFANGRIAECREVYSQVDKDGDGRLTTDELRSAAQSLGFSVSAEQLRQVHRAADVDNDGVVSFDERVAMASNRRCGKSVDSNLRGSNHASAGLSPFSCCCRPSTRRLSSRPLDRSISSRPRPSTLRRRR